MTRTVRVAPDAEALARLAAAELARRAADAVAERGRFAVALAGGTTPRRAYQLLAEPPHREEVPWARVLVFFGDERRVPPVDPDSNYRMAREAFLDAVALPPANIHRIRGEAADGDAAAEAYELELRSALGAAPGALPQLDVALLGMGPDGHVASLFPGSDALREERRLARAVEVAKPPARRITLTLPLFNAAAAVLVMVAGAEKAERVAEVLAGRAPGLPASRLAPAGELVWLLDAPAADRLPRGGRGGERAAHRVDGER